MNRLLLSAKLIERQALRYTPAGLPALDLLLMHESEVMQEGQRRKVQAEVKARAVGSVVRSASALELGSQAEFAGFLGGQRAGRGLLFHILELHPITSDAAPGFEGQPPAPRT